MQETIIHHLAFQIVAPPHGDSIILEVLDENDDAFMDVRIDKHDRKFVTVYELSKPISIPLSELARMIEIAEREVKNIGADSLFEKSKKDQSP